MPEKYRHPREQEIQENVTRMERAWEAERGALATVRRFNAANGRAWFWPNRPWIIPGQWSSNKYRPAQETKAQAA